MSFVGRDEGFGNFVGLFAFILKTAAHIPTLAWHSDSATKKELPQSGGWWGVMGVILRLSMIVSGIEMAMMEGRFKANRKKNLNWLAKTGSKMKTMNKSYRKE